MFSRESIADAQRIVHAAFAPTSQQMWPLLNTRLGAQVWVKHENHSPVGAFKVRGGLTYFDALRAREPDCRGVISATRGNHGQSVGFAAKRWACQPSSSCRMAIRWRRTHRCSVVSAHVTAYLDSFRVDHAVGSPAMTQLADGMAGRVPDQEALDVIRREVDDIITVI